MSVVVDDVKESWQWKAVVEKKAHHGRTVENVLRRPVNRRNVEVFLSCKSDSAKTFLREAEKEKQEGIQAQWQQESLAKEFLEQAKSCADTDCTHKRMRCGY